MNRPTTSPGRAARIWRWPCQSMSNTMSRPGGERVPRPGRAGCRSCGRTRPPIPATRRAGHGWRTAPGCGRNSARLPARPDAEARVVTLTERARSGSVAEQRRGVSEFCRRRTAPRPPGKCRGGRSSAHSMFCTCSRNCSIVAFSFRPVAVSATEADLLHSVLASRLNSWTRKSNRRPIAVPSASRASARADGRRAGRVPRARPSGRPAGRLPGRCAPRAGPASRRAGPAPFPACARAGRPAGRRPRRRRWCAGRRSHRAGGGA